MLPWPRVRARLVAAASCGVAACSMGPALSTLDGSRADLGFPGANAIVAVLEHPDATEGSTSEVVVYRGTARSVVAVEQPRSARWLSPHELLVASTSPDAADYLPRVQLHRVRLPRGEPQAFGPPGLYFDLAPSPDGELLALGVELEDFGDSSLQIWSLAGDWELLARRAQTLDRPRWSPSGRQLVVSQTRPDEADTEGMDSLAFEGVSLAWPRLFRLRRTLYGELEALHDGSPGRQVVAGGSLPLWWAEQSIYARQRAGLVACDPEGTGCTLVYTPGPSTKVLDGCPLDRDQALLLVLNGEIAGAGQHANEIHRVSLTTGDLVSLHRAGRTSSVISIDCAH